MSLEHPPTEAAVLALEDGSVFHGTAIGAAGQSTGEVVFNTAMTGYQEILTDPSYAQQIVTLTYPHIGNTGTNWEDDESDRVWASGLIIRDLPLLASNWRRQQTLDEFLREWEVTAIAEVDTRRLTRLLRDKGPLNGCLLSGPPLNDGGETEAVRLAKAFPGLKGMDLAQEVTTSEKYLWQEGLWDIKAGYSILPSDESNETKGIPKFTSKGQVIPPGDKRDRTAAAPPHYKHRVVAYDFGIKRNILRMLAARGCEVIVVPAKTPAAEALALKPDGIFLSNGPGDPEPCDYAIEAVGELLSRDIPLFGICLGCQLLALACGAKTLKMRLGHHGANHPVQDLRSGRVMITSQNHGFAVDEESLPASLTATHRSLFDGTLQGVEHTHKPAFAFQGHPEASPGPHDVGPLFDHFIHLMDGSKAKPSSKARPETQPRRQRASSPSAKTKA